MLNGATVQVLSRMWLLQATKQRRALDPDQRPPKPSKPDTSSTPEPLIAEHDEVPEEVNARVLQRILIFAGVPVFTGILLLPLIVYLKVCMMTLMSTRHLDPISHHIILP